MGGRHALRIAFMPHLTDYLWLGLSAFLAGGINALAGGGTLLTFPMLIGVLAPQYHRAAAVLANGTSTVALVPASLGSAWAFRRELAELRSLLVWLLPPSLIGGTIGSLLVTKLPAAVFALLVPWLILAAALLFLFQPLLVKRKAALVTEDGKPAQHLNGLHHITTGGLCGMIGLQFLIAIYGGYFGAGIGILMLSGLGLMGLTDIHQMNGLKAVLGTAINGVAIIVFVLEGKVLWPYALVMMGTSLVGGFVAAHYSRRLAGKYVRWFVIAIGFLLAAYFFSKTYATPATPPPVEAAIQGSL
jgi:uncharacterized membrane protein YfcA